MPLGVTLLVQPFELVRNADETLTMRPKDFPEPEDMTPSRSEGCLVLRGEHYEAAVEFLSRHTAKLVSMRQYRDVEISVTFVLRDTTYWTCHVFISKSVPQPLQEWAMAHAILDVLSGVFYKR